MDRNGGKNQQRARPFVNPQRMAASFCGALLCVCLPAAVWFALLPAANAVGCTSIVRPWKSPRDRAGKPQHKQRTEKTSRVFYGLGEALLDVENHRSRHSRFVGIPKGPCPFGASFSILSVRAESMACGARPPLRSGKKPGGRLRYAAEKSTRRAFPLRSGKRAQRSTSSLTLRGKCPSGAFKDK